MGLFESSRTLIKCPSCGGAGAAHNFGGTCNECITKMIGSSKELPMGGAELRLSLDPSFAQGQQGTQAHVSPSGARSSEHQPRFDLIPIEGLTRLARRFEEGAAKHGEDNWRKGLDDREWLLERVNHAIVHLHNIAYKIKTADLDDEDDAAAVAWAGVVLATALRPNKRG